MTREKFIKDVVLGWIKCDLIRMIESIKPDKSKVGNINFPIALCILSNIEYLGGFLLGEDKEFTDNVREYIKLCFNSPEEYPVDILRDLIRNGLAHDYFPRGAVSRNGKHPAIYRGKSYSLVLDAETLANDFINSLNIFIEKLDDKKYEKRMNEALNKIEKFTKKHKGFIDNLENQPYDDGQATPSSGPSGCFGP